MAMKRVRLWFAAATCLLAGGCGTGLVDVTAKVTLDGAPVEGAAVSLVSDGEPKTRTASGRSDANGEVRFTTFHANDGVMPGVYKVVVVKSPSSQTEEMDKFLETFDPNNPEDQKQLLLLQQAGNRARTPTILPRVYLDPQLTPLTCTISSDTKVVAFDLSSDAGNGTDGS